MLIVAFVIEILIMLGVPVALGFWLRKKWGLPWALFFIGAVTFVASQVVHVPLNVGLAMISKGLPPELVPQPSDAWGLLLNAALLGLTAGLCEELARYLVLRFWLRDARTREHAILFGAGHGGFESVLTGVLVVVTIVNMLIMRDQDPAALGVPPEMVQETARQVAEFWALPVYMPLLAAAERVMAIVLHLALSALVMQAFLRKRLWFLFVAIGWHSLVDAIAVIVVATWGAVAVEGVMVLLTLISATVLWATWRASRGSESKTSAA